MKSSSERTLGIVLVLVGLVSISGYFLFVRRAESNPLLQGLQSPDLVTRTKAVEKATSLGPEEKKTVLKLLDSPLEQEAATAVQVLEKANTRESRQMLVDAIETRTAGPEAVRALARLRDVSALASMAEALQSTSPGDGIRADITQALGDIGDPQSIPTLEAFLRNHRPPSGAWMKGSSIRENEARVHAIASLARLDPRNEIARDSVFELWSMIRVGAMSPESEALQLVALRTLALIPTEDALKVVRRAIEHETPAVQSEAIRVFALKKPPDRGKVLAELAERGSSQEARKTAKDLLAL